LIAIARLQLALDGLHFIKEAIESCVFPSEQSCILIERYSNERLYELIHRPVLELVQLLHGLGMLAWLEGSAVESDEGHSGIACLWVSARIGH
jgi:hypothetical protein